MGKSSSSMSLQGLCMVGALQLLWVLSLFHGASAQSSNCTTSFANLSPCLNYIAAGNTTKPSSDCCTPLASIITSDPACICQIASLAQGYTFNKSRALEVVDECNQTVPPSVTSCLQALVPAGSPSGSPGSPSTPGTTSQGQSDGSSHGSALFPPMLLIASIFVALSLNLGMST